MTQPERWPSLRHLKNHSSPTLDSESRTASVGGKLQWVPPVVSSRCAPQVFKFVRDVDRERGTGDRLRGVRVDDRLRLMVRLPVALTLPLPLPVVVALALEVTDGDIVGEDDIESLPLTLSTASGPGLPVGLSSAGAALVTTITLSE
jgi:hypothetical protein